MIYTINYLWDLVLIPMVWLLNIFVPAGDIGPLTFIVWSGFTFFMVILGILVVKHVKGRIFKELLFLCGILSIIGLINIQLENTFDTWRRNSFIQKGETIVMSVDTCKRSQNQIICMLALQNLPDIEMIHRYKDTATNKAIVTVSISHPKKAGIYPRDTAFPNWYSEVWSEVTVNTAKKEGHSTIRLDLNDSTFDPYAFYISGFELIVGFDHYGLRKVNIPLRDYL